MRKKSVEQKERHRKGMTSKKRKKKLNCIKNEARNGENEKKFKGTRQTKEVENEKRESQKAKTEGENE